MKNMQQYENYNSSRNQIQNFSYQNYLHKQSSRWNEIFLPPVLQRFVSAQSNRITSSTTQVILIIFNLIFTFKA